MRKRPDQYLAVVSAQRLFVLFGSSILENSLALLPARLSGIRLLVHLSHMVPQPHRARKTLIQHVTESRKRT